MNKIIIDTNVYNLNINNKEIIELINLDNNLDIIINVFSKEESIINFYIKNSLVNITINLYQNSNLIINQLGINSSININSNINSFCNLKYNLSILTNKDSINNILINNIGNSSNCCFYTNGINLNNNKLFFIIDGIINKDCFDINLSENSKIINIKDGNSKIIPNLQIDSKEVNAIHSAYIGNFDKEIIYYLNSRGISINNAKYLLFKAILLGNMIGDKQMFLNIINEFNKGDLYE